MPPPIDETFLLLKRTAFAHSKRERSYQACTPCRNRKLKCSQPEQGLDCPRCLKDGWECVWAVARTKRGCEKILRRESQTLRARHKKLTKVGLKRSKGPDKEARPKPRVVPVPLEILGRDDACLMDDLRVSAFDLAEGPVDNHLTEMIDLDESGGLAEGDIGAGATLDYLLFDRWHENFEGILVLRLNAQESICVEDGFSTAGSSDGSSSSIEILETRRRVLEGFSLQSSEATIPSPIDNRSHYLWEGIWIIMKHIKMLLFPSKQHTAMLISNGAYLFEIHKFQPRLRGWKRDFDKLKGKRPLSYLRFSLI